MSGAEFIAVLGISASAIQVIQTCTKILSRIKEYRQHTPFNDLAIQLRLFTKDIEDLKSQDCRRYLNPDGEALLVQVLEGCRQQLEKLDDQILSLIPPANSSRFARTFRGIRSLRKDTKLHGLLGILSVYHSAITLHLSTHQLRTSNRLLEAMTSLESTILNKQEINPETSQAALNPLTAENRLSPTANHHESRLIQNRKRGLRCARGSFTCQCHSILKGTSQSWILTRPSCSALTMICDCDSRHYTWAISLLRRAFFLNLSLTWEQGFSITWALNYRATVECTSPGFLRLYKCELGLIDLHQACNELRQLRDEGQISFKDMDRHGKGWLEVIPTSSPSATLHLAKLWALQVLLRQPWAYSRRNVVQYGLLRWLIREGATISSERYKRGVLAAAGIDHS